MPSVSTLGVFAAASLALIAVPGPSVLYIVTRSIEHGRSAGLVSMLGVQAGALVHVTAAALGLSALLASSAVAFSAVTWVGGAYLVYLGIRRLRAGTLTDLGQNPPPVGRAALFRQGALVNVLNPKTAIFFLAFLPQFVDPARGTPALQALALGLCFIAIAILSDGTYALLAGSVGDRLRRNAAAALRLERVGGVLLILLGAVAVLSGVRRTA
ncbi:MAG TPA: LysE family translocator [Solirubrobacteraceae bacterium]|nr:LysE family translocator [Solirubrobacteraceae bacterium]